MLGLVVDGGDDSMSKCHKLFTKLCLEESLNSLGPTVKKIQMIMWDSSSSIAYVQVG